MKPSRYNIFVPLQRGRVLVYNSFSGALATWEEVELTSYQQIAKGETRALDSEIVRNLFYGGYLVENAIDELALLEHHYHAHRFNSELMTLTIAPTLSCNFGCDYCFQGKRKPHDVMKLEVQDAIVALVERAAPGIKKLGIAWYGGEPLLKRRIIEALSDRLISVCDRHGIQYSAMMVTNGYRLDLELARSLYQRRVGIIQVTLDGTPEYHDQRRILLSGKPTFERIMSNLKVVMENVPIHLSIRVNIDQRNRDQIRQLLDILVERGFSNRKNFKLYFAPVEAMTQGCHLVQDLTIGKSEYGQLETSLYRYGYEKGLTVLPYPPRFHGTCAAVRPKGMVITPKGHIHKCWDTVTNPLFAVGSIFDLDAFQTNEKMQEWLRWTPFDNNTCRNCKLLVNCAGACAYKFVHAGETRGEAAVLPCPSWKYSLQERLVLRAEAAGYILRDDYDLASIRTNPSQFSMDLTMSGGQELPQPMQEMLAQHTSGIQEGNNENFSITR